MSTLTWKIIQVFNNNVVLAEKGEERAVLLGRGIGFGRARGAAVNTNAIQEKFLLAGKQPPDQMAQLITEINPEVIALAREIAETAQFTCHVEIPDSTVVAMADHIHFAIERAAQGITMPNPLKWEVSQFYTREYAFGRKALTHIKSQTGVLLPEDEAVSMALHVVNAQFANSTNQQSMAQTTKLTTLLTRVFDVVETALPKENINRESMSAARFVTHLRFLLQRMIGREDNTIEEAPSLNKLSDKIADEYPVAHSVAGKVIMMLELELDTISSDDESAYLTLHIARLMKTPH